jgi:cystathionine beta-lyase/cystathionine gamma-synthase
VRVEKQAANATKLVKWLDNALNPEKVSGDNPPGSVDDTIIREVLAKIEHASLQEDDIKDGWLMKQMPNGFGPVFSITMKEKNFARRLPSKLRLFHHATSLGGVESLIEWRTMTDVKVDNRLLRISIGLEGWEDLKEDLLQGFKALVTELHEDEKN